MIYNFEEWRKAKQALYTCDGLMHYHRVSDTRWSVVRDLLQGLVSNFVATRRVTGRVQMSAELAETVYQFVAEMDLAYIHPRSTSARVEWRAAQNRPSNPSHVKNLSV